jgi:hypothetical protein
MPTEEENQTETQPAERAEEPAPALDTPAPIGDGIETPPDPVSPAVSPEPAVTIEDQGIAANEPYPTGNPRDPEDDFEAAHGFRREVPKEGQP